MVSNLDQQCEKYGMRISRDKTEVMVTSREPRGEGMGREGGGEGRGGEGRGGEGRGGEGEGRGGKGEGEGSGGEGRGYHTI